MLIVCSSIALTSDSSRFFRSSILVLRSLIFHLSSLISSMLFCFSFSKSAIVDLSFLSFSLNYLRSAFTFWSSFSILEIVSFDLLSLILLRGVSLEISLRTTSFVFSFWISWFFVFIIFMWFRLASCSMLLFLGQLRIKIDNLFLQLHDFMVFFLINSLELFVCSEQVLYHIVLRSIFSLRSRLCIQRISRYFTFVHLRKELIDDCSQSHSLVHQNVVFCFELMELRVSNVSFDVKQLFVFDSGIFF